MSAQPEVCVDAGLVIIQVVTEPGSGSADRLFEHWAREGRTMIAPTFFEAEADSILRKKVALRSELTEEEAEGAFLDLRAIPIQPVSVFGQRRRAWNLGVEFGFPTVYDAVYLALADLRGCEFWTADTRLLNRVKDRLPFVRWLGDFLPTEEQPRVRDETTAED